MVIIISHIYFRFLCSPWSKDKFNYLYFLYYFFTRKIGTMSKKHPVAPSTYQIPSICITFFLKYLFQFIDSFEYFKLWKWFCLSFETWRKTSWTFICFVSLELPNTFYLQDTSLVRYLRSSYCYLWKSSTKQVLLPNGFCRQVVMRTILLFGFQG